MDMIKNVFQPQEHNGGLATPDGAEQSPRSSMDHGHSDHGYIEGDGSAIEMDDISVSNLIVSKRTGDSAQGSVQIHTSGGRDNNDASYSIDLAGEKPAGPSSDFSNTAIAPSSSSRRGPLRSSHGAESRRIPRRISIDDISVGHLSCSSLLVGFGGDDAERRQSSLLRGEIDDDEDAIAGGERLSSPESVELKAMSSTDNSRRRLSSGEASQRSRHRSSVDDIGVGHLRRSSLLVGYGGDNAEKRRSSLLLGWGDESVGDLSVMTGECSGSVAASGPARNRRRSTSRRVSIDDICIGRQGSDRSLGLQDVMEEAVEDTVPYHYSKSSRSSLNILKQSLREAGVAIHKAMHQQHQQQHGAATSSYGGGGVFITWDDLKKQGKAPPEFGGSMGRRLTPSQRRQAEAAKVTKAPAGVQNEKPCDRVPQEELSPQAAYDQHHHQPSQAPDQRRHFQRAWQTMDTARQSLDEQERGQVHPPLTAHFQHMHSSGPIMFDPSSDYLPLPMERDKRFKRSSMDMVKSHLNNTGAALQRMVRPMGGRGSMDHVGGREWASGDQSNSNMIDTNVVRRAIVQDAADSRTRNSQEVSRMSLVCCPANAKDRNSKLIVDDPPQDEKRKGRSDPSHSGSSTLTPPMSNTPIKSTMDYSIAFEQGRRAAAEQSHSLRGGRRAGLHAVRFQARRLDHEIDPAKAGREGAIFGEDEPPPSVASRAPFLASQKTVELQRSMVRKSTYGLDIELDALKVTERDDSDDEE